MASSALDSYIAAVEQFAEDHLRPYLDRMEASSARFKPKVVNDPVWGTIALNPIEVVLLDSPLFQRLRRIRQLGVAHLVYPGATHSRLEHSLGVVYMVARLVAATNRESRVIDVPLGNMLRLAGLCHDLGHGVMSHVSDNALEDFPAVKQLLLDFLDEHSTEKVRLSEIASYHLVGSGAFQELLERARDLTGAELPRDCANKIQAAIIGLPVSDDLPNVNELISGPFDADKLDYMPRDAQMSGVPVVTDIPRLIEKVESVDLAQDALPLSIAAHVAEGLPSYKMIGLALSGASTLDELMFGRTLLYEKIYRHHKVRAVESMVTSLLEQLSPLTSEIEGMLPLTWFDDELIALDENRIRARTLPNRRRRTKVPQRVAVALDLARRIEQRQLFGRAFAFAQTMPLDPYRADPIQWKGLEELMRDAREPTRRAALLKQIVDETDALVMALGGTDELSLPDDLMPFVRINPADAAPLQTSEIYRAWLVTPSGELRRFRDDAAETKSWADAYLLARDIGYVFCPQEWAPYVHLATEKLVRSKYQIRMPESMLSYAKQDPDRIREFRTRLEAANYYHDSPNDLLPVPRRLTRADVPRHLREVRDRLAGYQPPARGTEVLDLTEDRIKHWLAQFRDESTISAALQVVRRLRLVGRSELVKAAIEFITANEPFRNAQICTLGSGRDSSTVTTYYAEDVRAMYPNIEVGTRLDVALDSGRPIIFTDDFIGSGDQSISIVENWLGVAPSTELHEERQDALSGDGPEKLRQANVAFVFAAGAQSGVDALSSRLRELEFDNYQVTAYLKDDQLPRVFDGDAFESAEQAEAFLARAADIGRDLLSDPSARHDQDWVDQRALGYGNLGYLVVFPYNCPTQTLTCLWASRPGSDWTPLFPRRPKQ